MNILDKVKIRWTSTVWYLKTNEFSWQQKQALILSHASIYWGWACLAWRSMGVLEITSLSANFIFLYVLPILSFISSILLTKIRYYLVKEAKVFVFKEMQNYNVLVECWRRHRNSKNDALEEELRWWRGRGAINLSCPLDTTRLLSNHSEHLRN